MLSNPRRRSRGLSLVELMVGLAVGLVVVTGALTLMVRLQTTSWHLLLETRLNQDLRAAADVIARDLRRGGYWGNAIQGTKAQGGGSAAMQNPYSAVSGSTGSGLAYRFTRDVTENNTLDDGEQFGFRLHEGVLQMQTSNGNWQDLTDNKNMSVTAFTITPSVTTLPIGNQCPKTCAAGTPNCPASLVRSFGIALTGQANRDNAIVRSVNMTVRVRNDQLTGQCPT